MTLPITSIGLLDADQVKSVIGAAVLAPSTHNTQPWRFRCTPAGIELHADPDRALAGGRRRPAGTGAVLRGRAVQPAHRHPRARHRPGDHPAPPARRSRRCWRWSGRSRPASPIPRLVRLADAIPRRHTNRTPFEAAAHPGHGRRRTAPRRRGRAGLAAPAGRAPAGRPARAGAQEPPGPADRPGVPRRVAVLDRRDNRQPRRRPRVRCRRDAPRDNDGWVLGTSARGEREPTSRPGLGEPLVVVIGSFDDPSDRPAPRRPGHAASAARRPPPPGWTRRSSRSRSRSHRYGRSCASCSAAGCGRRSCCGSAAATPAPWTPRRLAGRRPAEKSDAAERLVALVAQLGGEDRSLRAAFHARAWSAAARRSSSLSSRPGTSARRSAGWSGPRRSAPAGCVSWSDSSDSGPFLAALSRSLAINAAAAWASSRDLPAPTSRTAETRSMPLMSLMTNPLAPAITASSIACSSV